MPKASRWSTTTAGRAASSPRTWTSRSSASRRRRCARRSSSRAPSNGGWTSAGSQPYLVAQPDPYEADSGNPYASWTATLTSAQLEKEWPEVGTLTHLSLTRDGNGDYGGRVTQAVLTGDQGSVTVTGDDLRYVMGDGGRSTWFQLQKATPRDLVHRLFSGGA